MKKSRNAYFIMSLFLIIQSILTVSASGAEEAVTKAADSIIIKIIFGDPSASFDSFGGAPLGLAGAIIIHLMIWMILFVAFSDIFGTFMPFTNKFVPWIIGFGMAVIVSNFGFIPTLIAWSAAILAGFGAAAVFIGIGLAFVFFVIATFFGNKLKIMILKQKIGIASAIGSEKTAHGIEGLAKAYGAFKEAAKE